jgi:hypothetical protein
MPNVEHRGSLSVLNEMPSHDMASYTNDIWICEMWAIAEGIGNISTNATQRCATRIFDFCGDTNCV